MSNLYKHGTLDQKLDVMLKAVTQATQNGKVLTTRRRIAACLGHKALNPADRLLLDILIERGKIKGGWQTLPTHLHLKRRVYVLAIQEKHGFFR